MTLEEVKQPTLTERAYEKLLEAIVSGTFQPEQKLTVGKIAEQLGLSPTPIKQAMSRLAGEGFIRLVPRHGFFITSVSIEYLGELYDARLMCELYAVRRTPPKPDAQFIADLERLSQQYEQCFRNGGSPIELARAGKQFHSHIVGLAKNSVIWDWFQKLAVHHWDLYFRINQQGEYGSRPQVIEEHKLIVRAIADGDVKQASTCLTEHIEGSKQYLFKVIKPKLLGST